MKVWIAAILGLGCLAAAGCRANQALIALENENRQLEDLVYQKQAELEDEHRRLEACRAELEKLRKEGAAAPSASAEPSRPEGPDLSRPSVSVELPSTPSSQMPETLRGDDAPRFPAHEPRPEKRKEPVYQPPALPEEPAERSGPASPSSHQPASPPKADSRRSQPAAPKADSARVAAITVNEALTSGCHQDAQGNDQGISLVLEPRDAEGRRVAAAAPVSVVVLDPAFRDESARVARWDFTAEEVASRYHRGPWGEGFHLEMRWPGRPPVHRQLQLFVRYTTSDGRKLETSAPIQVAAASDPRQGPATESDAAARTAQRWQQKPPAPAPPAASVSPSPPPPAAPRLQRPSWSPERQ